MPSFIDRDHQKALAKVLRKEGLSREFRVIFGCTHDPERLIQGQDSQAVCIARKQPRFIKIPPLRDRKKDISIVAQGILDEFSIRVGQPRRRITPAAVDWFCGQKWWGNESELEMAVCRAFLVSKGNSISLDDLSPTPPGKGRRRHRGLFPHKALLGGHRPG